MRGLGSTEDDACGLYHPPTSGDTPPLSGWQWCDEDDQHHDAPTLVTSVTTPGPLSPPLTITLQAEGELAAKYPHHLGTFTKTDQCTAGKLLYYSFSS